MSEPFALTIEQRGELRRIFMESLGDAGYPVSLRICPAPADPGYAAVVADGAPIRMNWTTHLDDGRVMRGSLCIAPIQPAEITWELCKCNARNLGRQVRYALKEQGAAA